VHEALETVEAPPAESLAGRVLALHSVLEAQRVADKRTADQSAVGWMQRLEAERDAARVERDRWKATARQHMGGGETWGGRPFTGPSITTG
jgi:hypothetical protein